MGQFMIQVADRETFLVALSICLIALLVYLYCARS
jgi:cbb3-type cytochrome oxidase subunit 3